MKILYLTVCATAATFAQGPDIEQIMSRVGRSQAKAQDLRQNFTYRQKQLLRMNRGNHKLAREERREYEVTPGVRGIKKELIRFEGKYDYKGKPVAYDRPGYR